MLKLHFEELVNDRPAALGRILDHFLARVPLAAPRPQALAALEASINPARSPTFRSGKTGEWKQRFTAEHKRQFKQAAGDLLIRLGYEKDNEW